MMIYSQLKDDFNAFLKNYALWIAIAIVAVIVIVTVLLILLNKKKKNPKDEILKTSNDDWVNALGGKENILEVNATGSRLSVKLVDINKPDKEKLKQLGVSNIVTMSDKLVLVVEDKAEAIKEKLN